MASEQIRIPTILSGLKGIYRTSPYEYEQSAPLKNIRETNSIIVWIEEPLSIDNRYNQEISNIPIWMQVNS